MRYISAAFEKRYDELVKDGDGFENDPDFYVEENIFFVPEAARWNRIATAAHTPEIGKVLDEAMIAVEKDNKNLKGVLPKNYAAPELDKRVCFCKLFLGRCPDGLRKGHWILHQG